MDFKYINLITEDIEHLEKVKEKLVELIDECIHRNKQLNTIRIKKSVQK